MGAGVFNQCHCFSDTCLCRPTALNGLNSTFRLRVVVITTSHVMQNSESAIAVTEKSKMKTPRPWPGQALGGNFTLKERSRTQRDTFFGHHDDGSKRKLLIKLVGKGSKSLKWRWDWWSGILPRSYFCFHKGKAKKELFPFVLQTSLKHIRICVCVCVCVHVCM